MQYIYIYICTFIYFVYYSGDGDQFAGGGKSSSKHAALLDNQNMMMF